jgi:arylsulfatase A-like enzyme
MRTIVFVLRGCPSSWLGAYGNEWVGGPNLDRIAAEGIVFDRHISDCPTADAASRVWRSGRHQLPPILGPTATTGVPSPVCDDVLLPALRQAGARTVLVRANHPDTDAPPPYYAGWDEVFDARPRPDDDSPLDALIAALPSVLDRLAIVPRWLLWIETDRLLPPWDVRQDVFEAYLEDGEEEETATPDEHELSGDLAGDEEWDESEDEGEEAPPFEADEPDEPESPADEAEDAQEEEDEPDELPPEVAALPEPDTGEPVTPFVDPPIGPFDRNDEAAWEWLHSTFAAVVTSLDAELGVVFDQLRTRGLDQTASWVITSDHGYPLGEHGQVGPYRPWLHEEFLHVPLLVRLPGAAEAGRRVAAFTQPADLAPTLLELLGADLPAGPLHGHSLLTLTRGEVESVRPYAVSGLTLGGGAEWALRSPEWAFLLPGPQPGDQPPRAMQLYEKPDDRWEVNDLRSRHPDLAERLECVLRGAIAAVERPGPLVLPPLEVVSPGEPVGEVS